MVSGETIVKWYVKRNVQFVIKQLVTAKPVMLGGTGQFVTQPAATDVTHATLRQEAVCFVLQERGEKLVAKSVKQKIANSNAATDGQDSAKPARAPLSEPFATYLVINLQIVLLTYVQKKQA